MLNSKKLYLWFLVLPIAFYLLNFTGCATVPTKEAFPSYNINGTTYLPLVSLCDSKGINWDYDSFTRAVVLTKDAHKINLMVGDTLVLLDGQPLHMSHPVDIYQGTVVVPYKFKEQILDTLFKQTISPPKVATCVLRIRKVVIDAGHGGNDPGAIGRSGLREKDVNLDIAKRISKLLRSEGVDVVMTRNTDSFIPLPRRVEIANNSRADLFIAVHSNANRVRSMNGLEVYYVSTSADDSKRAYASARNAALDFNSDCFASNSLDLKATLWDMSYTRSRAESIELSRSICKAIENNLGIRIIGIKGARYEVLRGARMPAVLVEVGFLSNGNEEHMLKNSYYRQKIAESIVEGVHGYAQTIALTETARK
jgi:N-acetylmuramoyl-L-alanine amidase